MNFNRVDVVQNEFLIFIYLKNERKMDSVKFLGNNGTKRTNVNRNMCDEYFSFSFIVYEFICKTKRMKVCTMYMHRLLFICTYVGINV